MYRNGKIVNKLQFYIEKNDSIAIFLFVFAFPIIFLNHVAVATSIIPEYLVIPWHFPISLAAVMFFSIFFRKKYVLSRTLIFLLTLITCVSVYTLLDLYTNIENNNSKILAIQNIKIIVGWLGLYYIGYNLTFSNYRYKILLILSFAMMMLIISLYNIETFSFVVTNLYRSPEHIGHYQLLGLCFCITSLYIFSYSTDNLFYRVIVLVSLVCSFILFSRADFFALSFVVICLISVDFYHNGKPVFKKYATATCIVLAAFILVHAVKNFRIVGSPASQVTPITQPNPSATTPNPSATTPNPSATTPSPAVSEPAVVEKPLAGVYHESAVQRLVEIVNSKSVRIRLEVLKGGIQDILSSPIAGVYGGHMKFGNQGTYIHNALSAWHLFGLLPFLIYVYLNFSAVFYFSKRIISQQKKSPILYFGLYMSLFSILLIIIAKSVFWPIPAIVWGCLSSVKDQEYCDK